MIVNEKNKIIYESQSIYIFIYIYFIFYEVSNDIYNKIELIKKCVLIVNEFGSQSLPVVTNSLFYFFDPQNQQSTISPLVSSTALSS